MKFINNNGVVEKVSKGWPTTVRGSIRASIQKYEFMENEIEAGRPITDNGAEDTCALCHLNFSCSTCAIFLISCRPEARGCSMTPYNGIIDDCNPDDSIKLNYVKSMKYFIMALLED